MMEDPSPKDVTYQYPDPDEAAYNSRYAWARDDNDHVPPALQHSSLSSWTDDEAEEEDSAQLAPGESHGYNCDDTAYQRDRRVLDTEYEAFETDESDEGMSSEEDNTDHHRLAANVKLHDSGGLGDARRRTRHGPGTRGRRGDRGVPGGTGRGGRGGRGGKRGLRNPIEPEPEFKALHSRATMAFIANDYDEAEALTLEALQINPEMYPAHSLLSQIHAARGDGDKALVAAWNGAHTRPRDTDMWSRIARMLLDRDKEHKAPTLKDAIYCYARIISIDRYKVEARYQRAALNRELGKLKQVATEYEQLNKYLPHDTTVLRHLAQVSIELDEPERALKHYRATVSHFRRLEPTDPTSFTWSDVNVLVELYYFSREYDEGIEVAKSLSRWLLGRGSDGCWDNFTEDDREWDLSDEPRRIKVPEFVPHRYEATTYGDGLPLDLRIKLGMFRLKLGNQNLEEALNHFEWLDPENCWIGAKLFDYSDLFRVVAKSLAEAGFYSEALRFYEPLRQLDNYVDPSYLSEISICYTAVGQQTKAEECSRAILEFNDNDAEANSKSVQMRDETLLSEDEVTSEPGSGPFVEEHGSTKGNIYPPIVELRATVEQQSNAMLAPPPSAPQRAKKPSAEKCVIEIENLEELFAQRQSLGGFLRQDEPNSRDLWVSITKRLVESFMAEKAFYPEQRHNEFMGYTPQARHLAKRKLREKELAIESQQEIDDKPMVVPDHFGGVSFKDWLDIFLEYGLSLAHEGDMKGAYQVMTSATQVNIFYHSVDSLFLIHVCWFSCALMANDDETLCYVARWFMKDYQFTTDGYRLFSALNRLSDSDHSWFNCGPSQKYILRQVKAVDFLLVGDGRGRNYQERAAYTAKDSNGNTILAQDMDVSLLMLYGHILYAGKSYAYANNYFLRALSADPDNSIIKLSLALGYIHHALKRQADNRHQLLMQGFAFLFEYYDHRQKEGGFSEKQEAAYNVARAYHLLGLTHSATPFYEECLGLSENVQAAYEGTRLEDFSQEAAFALQGIWAANGNAQRALEVTERWLQL